MQRYIIEIYIQLSDKYVKRQNVCRSTHSMMTLVSSLVCMVKPYTMCLKARFKRCMCMVIIKIAKWNIFWFPLYKLVSKCLSQDSFLISLICVCSWKLSFFQTILLFCNVKSLSITNSNIIFTLISRNVTNLH